MNSDAKHYHFQIRLWQNISIYLLVWLMSIGFAFGQTADERKLELVVQTGHTREVLSVTFSPDGKLLASGGSDATIKLWNVETGQQIKSLGGYTSQVNSLAFSPDGKILASESSDNTIKLWNVATGREIKSLDGSGPVAFSPDGKTLASGSSDNTIKLWSIESGQEIKSLSGHTYPVQTVAFSPDGKIIASGSDDNKIKLWNLETGREIKSLTGHPGRVWSVAFSPDGKLLASGDIGGTSLWNVETGRKIKSLDDNGGSVAFSPDGKLLVSVDEWDGTVKLWNVESGRVIKSLNENADSVGNRAVVSSVAFSPDGKTLASSSGYATINLWSVKTGRQIKSLSGRAYPIRSVTFSPDGKLLASSNDARTIKLWSVGTGRQIKSLSGHTDLVTSVAFSPDGKTLASGSDDGTIKLWSIESGQEIKSLTVQTKESKPFRENLVRSVAFSPDGKLLASGSSDNTIRLWSVESGQEIKSLTGHASWVLSVAFSPDGKTLASGGSNNAIELWNVESGQEIKSLIGHDDSVSSVAFSPDGKLLASSGCKDKTIKLWNVENGQEIKSLTGHAKEVNSVAFSPDGKTLVSGSYDIKIKLWNVETGQEIKSLSGHTDFVASVAFSPVTNFFVSGSLDGTMKLWNTEKNKAVATLTSLGENDWVVIDEDGRFDASEGALKLMHYTYGLEIINLDQLKEAYYEPGLLQELLGYSKEHLRPIIPLKDVKLYPEIVEQKFDEQSGKLNIKLKNRGGGIGKTEVFVNDKRVVEDARDERLKKNPNVADGEIVSLSVALPPESFVSGGENQIKVVTSNYLMEIGKGNIQSRGTELAFRDTGKKDLELPTLYAIVGGVSDYAGEGLDLRFAAKDAEDFSNALQLGAKRLFGVDKVQIRTFSTNRQTADEQPTKENFKKAFAEFAAKAKPEDIFLVYLAGHGVTLGTGTDTYFYLTKEARSMKQTDLETNFQTVAISNAELIDWLTPDNAKPDDIYIKALKQVVILDTCAAGNFAREDWKKDRDGLTGDQIRAMEFLKDKTGTFVLMGSAANAVSYEANSYNQGLLTYSLLEGMKGLALQNATANVDVRLLFDYVEKRVPELAKQMNLDQRPLIRQPSGNTFIIGQMTDAEKQQINLPQPKPLLLRPLLTNPETGDDDLKLIPDLRKMFDAESSYEIVRQRGGKEPILIYLDDDAFPKAVRVTGTYTVEGEKVRVKAFLRQDGNTIAALPEIVAAKDKVLDELLNVVRGELAKLK